MREKQTTICSRCESIACHCEPAPMPGLTYEGIPLTAMKQVRWALSHMMQAGVPKAPTLDDIMAKREELLGR